MKRLLLITVILLVLILIPSLVFVQGMMGNWTSSPSAVVSSNHTAREEAEGKDIWKKLQAKQTECKNLSDENFETLGEYFMGQMAGNSHEAMNTMMKQMMGEKGEQQMHIVMGKRLSGCDTSASGVGIMPMMGMIQMMRGAGNPMMGFGQYGGMMGGGFGVFGSLYSIIILADLVLLGIWLWKQIQKK